MLITLICGIVYSSKSLFYQVDVKRFVALFSINHCSILYALVMSLEFGSKMFIVILLGMLSHSFISIGLFAVIGLIIEKNNNRFTNASLMISWNTKYCLLFLLLANNAFPISLFFFSELLNFTLLSKCAIGVCVICVAFSFVTFVASFRFYSYFYLNLVNNDSTYSSFVMSFIVTLVASL